MGFHLEFPLQINRMQVKLMPKLLQRNLFRKMLLYVFFDPLNDGFLTVLLLQSKLNLDPVEQLKQRADTVKIILGNQRGDQLFDNADLGFRIQKLDETRIRIKDLFPLLLVVNRKMDHVYFIETIAVYSVSRSVKPDRACGYRIFFAVDHRIAPVLQKKNKLIALYRSFFRNITVPEKSVGGNKTGSVNIQSQSCDITH